MRIAIGLWLDSQGRVGPPVSAGALVEPADTISGAGNVAVPGAGSLTGASDAIAGAGSPVASGSGGLTDAADTIAGAGQGAVSGGIGALTEPPDTIAGAGNVAVPGSGALTGAADTIAGAGNVAVPGSGALTGTADTIAGSGPGSASGLATPTVTWGTGSTPSLNIDAALPTDATGWHLLIKVDDDPAFGSPAINADHTITSGEDLASAVSGILSSLGSGVYWAEVAIQNPSGTTSAFGVTPDTYTVTGGSSTGALTEPADTIAGAGNVAGPGTGALTGTADTIAGSGLGSASSLATPTVTWGTGSTPSLNIDAALPTDATGWHLLIKVDDDPAFGSPAINVDHTITSGEDLASAISGILSSLGSGVYWAEVAIQNPSGTTSAFGVTPDTYTVTSSSSTGALTDAADVIAGSGAGAPAAPGITNGQIFFLPRQANPAGVPFGLPLTLAQAA